MTLAAIEDADVGRTAALCLLHDAHETWIGDVPSVGRVYVTSAASEGVSQHQTSGMPDAAAKAFQELTAEFEAGATIEAQVARDADKLGTLLQAIEYQAQGHDTSAWQETSIAALRTDAAKQLAQAITATDPQWGQPSPPPTASFAQAHRDVAAPCVAESRHDRSERPTGRFAAVDWLLFAFDMLRTDMASER